MTATEARAGQRQAHIARSTLETQIDAGVDLDGGPVKRLRAFRFSTICWTRSAATESSASRSLRWRCRDGPPPHSRGHRHRAWPGCSRIARRPTRYRPIRPCVCAIGRGPGASRHRLLGSSLSPLRGSDAGAGHRRDFAASLIEEFWRAFVVNAAVTAHIDLIRARNAHHAAEAIFKAGALALHAATRKRATRDVPSTKGMLA